MIPLDLTKPAVKLALGLGAALVLTLLYLAVYYGGYRNGHATATDKGDARYAKLEKAHADALAEASAKALDLYVQEAQRADDLSADLLTARQRLAANRTFTLKEIPHATAGLDACSFGPGFLRVYGQALGYGAPTLPQAAGPGGNCGSARRRPRR